MNKGFSTNGTLHLSDRKVNGHMMQACGTSNNQRYTLIATTDEEIKTFTDQYGANAIKRCKRCFGS